MYGFFKNLLKLPPLSDFPLKNYTACFSFENLVPGVDNIRYDVLISPAFTNATREIVYKLMSRYAGIESKTLESASGEWPTEVDNYKQIYKELMLDAINKAKVSKQISVVYLVQTAVLKILLEQIRTQYDNLIVQMKKNVRQFDLSFYNENYQEEHRDINGNLRKIHLDRAAILQKVGKDICEFWAEIEQNEIQPMLEAIFGSCTQLFEKLLINPILHSQQYDNSFILLNEYDLCLGRRTNDPDKYEALIILVRQIFNTIGLHDPNFSGITAEQRSNPDFIQGNEDFLYKRRAFNEKIEGIIQYPDNVDLLFNWLRSKADYLNLKKEKAGRDELVKLKILMKNQRKFLNYFYKQFKLKGLINHISASYEMQPEHLKYCPPLNPQQIIQYLISSKTRKVIRKRLKRINQNYQQALSLRLLNKKIKSLKKATSFKHKIYLIRFFKALARYHQDLCNFKLIQNYMDQVNMATEDKIINLSRVNNTLYQFLLPDERPPEKATIINHVVVKVDVRGSTDITHQLVERGLNPASYFSLNFFDPISEIISEYNALKNFIEGDAVILSIFEYENAPTGWFCVSKACCIALNVLMIIKRYNEKSRKFQLPILELGIGISYSNKNPTFLFDHDNRIMISTAINQADRLSKCSKAGIRLFDNEKSFFNLYVFQINNDESIIDATDDNFLRYNVNGIELNLEGFEKLSNEIDLKLLQGNLTDMIKQKSNFYTGKFPTKSGYYQRLLIRESQIPIIDPVTFKIKSISERKYYEVCSNPDLYQWADQL